jgi:anti-sigma factor RsiW
MTCSDIEILLAEYIDGTLAPDVRSTLENHLASCADCRELARDASGAVAFLERTAAVDAPPELVTRILFEISNGPSHSAVRPSLPRRLFGRLFGGWLEPVLQPRLMMGMAMTVLFIFGMLGRARQLTPSDLDPVKVWTAAENRISRTWERGVKYYENMRLVFEIQSRLKEWNDEAPDAANAAASSSSGKGDNK